MTRRARRYIQRKKFRKEWRREFREGLINIQGNPLPIPWPMGPFYERILSEQDKTFTIALVDPQDDKTMAAIYNAAHESSKLHVTFIDETSLLPLHLPEQLISRFHKNTDHE